MSDQIYNYVITDDLEGERIDKVISELSESFSRTYIRKMLDEKRVTLNGKNVKASQAVAEGDEIRM